MNKNYVAKIGIPDNLRQVDSESNREVLISSASVYEAHKQALYKCQQPEEVLELTINGVSVYNINTGFTKPRA